MKTYIFVYNLFSHEFRVHSKWKRYVDDAFDLTLQNLHTRKNSEGRGGAKSNEISCRGGTTCKQKGEYNFENDSGTISSKLPFDIVGSVQKFEPFNEFKYSLQHKYERNKFSYANDFACYLKCEKNEDYAQFNDNYKRKFINDLIEFYNTLKIKDLEENTNYGGFARHDEDHTPNEKGNDERSIFKKNASSSDENEFNNHYADKSPLKEDKYISNGEKDVELSKMRLREMSHAYPSLSIKKHGNKNSEKACITRYAKNGGSNKNRQFFVQMRQNSNDDLKKSEQKNVEKNINGATHNREITKFKENACVYQNKAFTSVLRKYRNVEINSQKNVKKCNDLNEFSKRSAYMEKEKSVSNRGRSCTDIVHIIPKHVACFPHNKRDTSTCRGKKDLIRYSSEVFDNTKYFNKFHQWVSDDQTFSFDHKCFGKVNIGKETVKSRKGNKTKIELKKGNIKKKHDTSIECNSNKGFKHIIHSVNRKVDVHIDIAGNTRLEDIWKHREDEKARYKLSGVKLDSGDAPASLVEHEGDVKMSRNDKYGSVRGIKDICKDLENTAQVKSDVNKMSSGPQKKGPYTNNPSEKRKKCSKKAEEKSKKKVLEKSKMEIKKCWTESSAEEDRIFPSEGQKRKATKLKDNFNAYTSKKEMVENENLKKKKKISIKGNTNWDFYYHISDSVKVKSAHQWKSPKLARVGVYSRNSNSISSIGSRRGGLRKWSYGGNNLRSSKECVRRYRGNSSEKNGEEIKSINPKMFKNIKSYEENFCIFKHNISQEAIVLNSQWDDEKREREKGHPNNYPLYCDKIDKLKDDKNSTNEKCNIYYNNESCMYAREKYACIGNTYNGNVNKSEYTHGIRNDAVNDYVEGDEEKECKGVDSSNPSTSSVIDHNRREGCDLNFYNKRNSCSANKQYRYWQNIEQIYEYYYNDERQADGGFRGICNTPRENNGGVVNENGSSHRENSVSGNSVSGNSDRGNSDRGNSDRGNIDREHNDVHLDNLESIRSSEDKAHVGELLDDRVSLNGIVRGVWNNSYSTEYTQCDAIEREYMRESICKMLKGKNCDDEIKNLLNLFFKHMKMHRKCGESSYLRDGKRTKEVKKKILKRERRKRYYKIEGKKKQEHIGNPDNDGKWSKKWEKLYLDRIPNSMPLTKLIIRNFEENERNDNKGATVRYRVELTGLKNPVTVKQDIEKEKYLFSRIENIYNFCNLDKDEREEKCYNNIVNGHIPFPNMKLGCLKEPSAAEFVAFNSTRAEEKKNIPLNRNTELTNSEKSKSMFFSPITDIKNVEMGTIKKTSNKIANKTGNKIDSKTGNKVANETGIKNGNNNGDRNGNNNGDRSGNNNCDRNGNKTGKKSYLPRRILHNKLFKEYGGKHNYVAKMVSAKKGEVSSPFLGKKDSSKCDDNKSSLVLNGKEKKNGNGLTRTKVFSPLVTHKLERRDIKSKCTRFEDNIILTNFKEYVEKRRNSREMETKEGVFENEKRIWKSREDMNGMSYAKSLSAKVIEEKKGQNFILKSYTIPKEEEEIYRGKNASRYKELFADKGLKCWFKKVGSREKEDIQRVSTNKSVHTGRFSKKKDINSCHEECVMEGKDEVTSRQGRDALGSRDKCRNHCAHVEEIGDSIKEGFIHAEEEPCKEGENNDSKILRSKNDKCLVDGNVSKKGSSSDEEKSKANILRDGVKTFFGKENEKRIDIEGNCIRKEGNVVNRKTKSTDINNNMEVKNANFYNEDNKYMFKKNSVRLIKRLYTHERNNLKEEGRIEKEHIEDKIENLSNEIKKDIATLSKGEKKNIYKLKRKEGNKCNFVSKNADEIEKKKKKFNLDLIIPSKIAEMQGGKMKRSSAFYKNASKLDSKKGKMEGANKVISKNNKKGHTNSSIMVTEGNSSKSHRGSIDITEKKKEEEMLSTLSVRSNICICSNNNGIPGENTWGNVRRSLTSSNCNVSYGKTGCNLIDFNSIKKADIKIGKPVFKREKIKGKNVNYIDIKSLRCSKSTLHFLVEKKYLEGVISDVKEDKNQVLKKNKDLKETSEIDQFSYLGKNDDGKKQPYFFLNTLFNGKKKKKNSGTITANTTTTHEAETRELFTIPQIRANKIPSISSASAKKPNNFEKPTINEKNERAFNSPQITQKSESLTDKLRNIVRVKRELDIHDNNIIAFFSSEMESLQQMGCRTGGETEEQMGENIGEVVDEQRSDKIDGPISERNNEERGVPIPEKNGGKRKIFECLLTIKINIITVFLQDSQIKRVNMKGNFNIKVTIYSSNNIKTIENNCKTETFPCYFTSHMNGIGLSADAFKKVDVICGGESKEFFKLVISCRREKAFLKKELIRIYSRTFEAPVELKTYNLSRNKKYASETSGSNDDLYEMNGITCACNT
ncbi:conserved Plasmodium protein, unknown function [Plasmodium ovale wallikeri]|uniref:Uncharacterized protein n=1 Tax=Plasmodium ovale wallikeri TaxID=864142 RepID=A0A1A8YJJ4_PLAOA|nr:conserved Plasmodium protein, unknown function [Plasmodium ovale wallikeri]